MATRGVPLEKKEDSVATRGVPLEKKVDTKCMQVNVLRNIASMTKRGDGIPIYYIDRQYPDLLGM